MPHGIARKKCFNSLKKKKKDLLFSITCVGIECILMSASAAAKSLQSCPTLCYPIDGSPPGSAIPGILQARTPEWFPFPSPTHESEK